MAQTPTTVLVVDDDRDLRDAVSLVLRMLGYAVEGAANGAEALDTLGRHLPGVILLDMKMPVMDGWEFARQARSRFGPALPPIVVLTAAANHAARAAEIGAAGWLGKPFELDDLQDELARIMKGQAGSPATP